MLIVMKKINVLIAEDHLLTAKLLGRMLGKRNNINIVDISSNGRDVLKAVENAPVDVILMDVSMPLMDGIETMNNLKKNKKNIKVLMLSGHTEKTLIRRSVESGASGYLTKTVDMNEICSALETVYGGGTYFDELSMDSLYPKKLN